MTTAERNANRATAAANIVRQNANQYLVPSATTVGVIYPVRRIRGEWQCCCQHAIETAHLRRTQTVKPCWHIQAVQKIEAAERQAQRDTDPAMIAAREQALGLMMATGK